MQLTPTITFRGVDRTTAGLHATAQDVEAEKLTKVAVPIDEYGYIEAENWQEVYFRNGSMPKDAFDRLAVGSAVSFVEEPGEKGPQASTVKLLHPRRVHRASHAARGARVVR